MPPSPPETFDMPGKAGMMRAKITRMMKHCLNVKQQPLSECTSMAKIASLKWEKDCSIKKNFSDMEKGVILTFQDSGKNLLIAEDLNKNIK